MSPNFLNVDFELRSPTELSSLLVPLGSNIVVLVDEKAGDDFLLNFEIYSEATTDSISNKLELFLNLLDGLDPISLETLAQCHSRVVDIGFESGSNGWLYSKIPSKLLESISKYNFDICISIYGSDS